jgi:hypothetical protein
MTAVIWLALLSSKFATSFHAQSCFAGIASTQSLEKIAQQTFLSAVDTQSFRSDFHAKFCQRFLQIEK